MASMSLLSTSPTGLEQAARLFRHWSACLMLLQVGRRSLITWEQASANVGMDGVCLRWDSLATRFFRYRTPSLGHGGVVVVVEGPGVVHQSRSIAPRTWRRNVRCTGRYLAIAMPAGLLRVFAESAVRLPMCVPSIPTQ